LIELLAAAAICVNTPECAVHELRPQADLIICQRLNLNHWRCIAEMRNGHAFRYRVTRKYGPINGAEYPDGYLVARRVSGTWRLARK